MASVWSSRASRLFALQVLHQAAVLLEEYLGHAAVYVTMADVWYDKLYKHTVLGNTASDVGVVSQLDDIMNRVMGQAGEAAAADTAAAVARSSFAAMTTALLHGGVYRNFSSDDADLIQQDLDALRVRASTI